MINRANNISFGRIVKDPDAYMATPGRKRMKFLMGINNEKQLQHYLKPFDDINADLYISDEKYDGAIRFEVREKVEPGYYKGAELKEAYLDKFQNRNSLHHGDPLPPMIKVDGSEVRWEMDFYGNQTHVKDYNHLLKSMKNMGLYVRQAVKNVK